MKGGTSVQSVDLTVARRIVPELIDVLKQRARILQRICLLQPIGRRALAAELGTTERILRSEVEFLRQQGLLTSAPAGMSLTDEGQALLDEVEHILATLEGRTELAGRLARALGIGEVVVVSGDCDQDEWVKNTLGYQAAILLRTILKDGDILAVTGGTTLEAIAKMMPTKGGPMNVKVVPARGGLGERLAAQANTIASELARHLGGESFMLHVPDSLSEDTLQRLMEEPHIQERLSVIRQANVVVHGIGNAMKMAQRRGLPPEEIQLLQERGAVAEAFGYYFNPSGQIVHTMTTVGLKLDDLKGVRKVIGVAGGASKATAIAAAAKGYHIDVLVTDEGAARLLLEYTAHGGDKS
jgi:central glycolytic genes regulator